MREIRLLLTIILLLIVTSCGSETSPIIVTQLPTETATIAALPSPTVIAFEPTTTPFPTPTELPFTPTLGPTPTSPLGPTFTPAPPTLTATIAPTLFGMEIAFFTSDSELIAPGDNVTLFWEVNGAERITIYRLDQEGNREEPRPVNDSEGRLIVSTDPANLEQVQFVLVAELGEATLEETITIEVNCETAWFFSPAPEGCPSTPAEASLQVEQTFEHGRMIWIETTLEIYILFNDEETPRWLKVIDSFTEGSQERDETLIPPPNLIQPIRGFGLVWRTNPNIRERLGWATAGEVGYDGIRQQTGATEATIAIYLQSLDGTILELLPEGSDWRVVPLEEE